MGLRRFAAAIAFAAMLTAPVTAPAQNYPERPVKLILAFSAGGTLDVLARLVAHKLTGMWGHSVVVENRPGSAGMIGSTAAAAADPDGYTLHLGAQSLAVNVTLQPKAKLDPVEDFEPIMLVATAQDVLIVGAQSPFKSVQELIKYAKANPGKLTYGTINIGTSSHLSMTSFMTATGINVRMVPYTQSSQMVADVVSGRVDMQFPTTGGHVGNVKAGKVRALAVSGPERARLLPDVPTLREEGIVFEDEFELVRPFRTARHAQGDRRQDQPRHGEGAGRSGVADAHRHARLPPDRRAARAPARSYEGRGSQMGQGGQDAGVPRQAMSDARAEHDQLAKHDPEKRAPVFGSRSCVNAMRFQVG